MPRLNFTGRRRISHSHVQISVTGIGSLEVLSATLRLESYGFPAGARVIVEAYRQLELMRFDFGTVGCPEEPALNRLSEFGTLNGVRFRVKVVSADNPRGRLLGVADRLLPHDRLQESLLRVPLLAVKAQDLGREIWRLDFSDEPLLLVNSRAAGKRSLVQSAEFQSLVLPEILRSILSRIVLVDQIRSPEDADDWTGRWLRFAMSLPGVGDMPDDGDTELDLDWIDSVVASFCRWRGVDRQFRVFWQSRPADEPDAAVPDVAVPSSEESLRMS